MIFEAIVAGGGTFSAIALAVWGATRPARRTRTECERLHRVAAMERDIYGQVMSSDAAEHVAKCGKPRPFPPARASTVIRAEDVQAMRALVADCEQIKTLIQQRERLDKVRADLGVEGYEPDSRVAELRDVLEEKRKAIQALTNRFVC